MTIFLNESQIASLSAKAPNAIIGQQYTTFLNLYPLGEELFDEVAKELALPLTFAQALAVGYFQDLNKFQEFLKFSAVLRAALVTGQSNPAVRKLVFELVFWVQSEVGQNSPRTIAACWTELNTLTKGSIAKLVKPEDVVAWNKAIAVNRLAATMEIA